MARKLDRKIIKKIVLLREKGCSVPEISFKLSLPKTTVFNYARNVQMSESVLREWKSKRGGGRKLRLIREEAAKVYAEKVIESLSKKEKLLFLSALYWAEGNKKDFMLSNTDPNLIKVYIDTLRSVFEIDNSRLRVNIRIYEDMNEEKCLRFWSNLINVSRQNFQKTYVLKGKKQGKLEFGMCRIRVIKGGDLLKKVQAVNKIVANQVSIR